MSLSTRGKTWSTASNSLLIWQIIPNLWHPLSNPSGYVSLGVAENALMHSELQTRIKQTLSKPLPLQSLTYGDGGAGSKRTRAVLAQFLNRKLRPVVRIEAAHVCVTNGVTTAIEHLSSVLADPGDVWLLGQPHYGAFIDDIQLRTGVEVRRVAFGDRDPLGMGALERYESVFRECLAEGKRVAGLMLCNPHNPLGRCYPREVIIELMRMCQRYGTHLVSDEIYAFSVFHAEAPAVPFTSLASIDTEGLIDPALTHVLYGLSKDFGANGLRLGCLVSQHNEELHRALVPVSIYSYASSLAEAVVVGILEDDDWVDWYIAENCRRLRKCYDIVRGWADGHEVRYAVGVNAAFFLWVNLGKVYKRKLEREGQEVPDDAELNQKVQDALLKQKVFLASGSTFGSEEPGWFRTVFSQEEENVREGLRRIESALGL